jgi:hypothetical protein
MAINKKAGVAFGTVEVRCFRSGGETEDDKEGRQRRLLLGVLLAKLKE